MRAHPNKFKGLRVLRFTKRITWKHRPANCAPALMGSLDGSEGQRTNAVARLRLRHSVSTLPKSNRRTIRRLAGFSISRRARHGSPFVLQWRTHPAVADGYRSRCGAAGPPAFLLVGGEGVG